MVTVAGRDPLVNVRLGSCVIQRRLGSGGMGTVYLAQHTGLNRSVAIKILSRDLQAQEEFVRRFLREARLAAKLDHPNIVQVYDVGEGEHGTFIVMQYVDGRTLDEILKERKKLTTREALSVVKRVARALSSAHKAGVIHRDVKPGNIMISRDGIVKVADFGLARDLDAGQTVSQAGQIVGTPHYMSPEQAAGTAVDGRSDLYSLGATLYHMVTGRRMFDGDSALSVLLKHLNEPPQEPREIDPTVPEPVAAIIKRLLEKTPANRYQTADDLVREIDAVHAGTGRTQVRIAPRPPSRRRRWALLAPVLILAPVLYFVYRAAGRSESPASPNRERKAGVDDCVRDYFRAIGRLDLEGVRALVGDPKAITAEGVAELRKFLLGDRGAKLESATVLKVEPGPQDFEARVRTAIPVEGRDRPLEVGTVWIRREEGWRMAGFVPETRHAMRLEGIRSKFPRSQQAWVVELDRKLHRLGRALRSRNAAEFASVLPKFAKRLSSQEGWDLLYKSLFGDAKARLIEEKMLDVKLEDGLLPRAQMSVEFLVQGSRAGGPRTVFKSIPWIQVQREWVVDLAKIGLRQRRRD